MLDDGLAHARLLERVGGLGAVDRPAGLERGRGFVDHRVMRGAIPRRRRRRINQLVALGQVRGRVQILGRQPVEARQRAPVSPSACVVLQRRAAIERRGISAVKKSGA
jgi:hypothetical protein